MGLYILIGVASIVVTAVTLILLSISRQNKKLKLQNKKFQETSERQSRAIWAKALIVHSRGGLGIEGGEEALLTLTLEVSPPNGNCYRATTSWIVKITEIGSLSQGQEILVKIDSENSKVVYPNYNWARYVPM